MRISISTHLLGKARVRASRILLAFMLCAWFPAIAAAGRLVSFQTAQSGPETNLASITVDDARQTIPASSLIQTTLVHYFVASSTTGTTQAIISPRPLDEVNSNPRSPFIAGDLALNTGLFNVPLGTGIPAGQSPGNVDGICLQFAQPIVNGPGDDIVFFDFRSPFEPATPDPFYATGIVDGVSIGSWLVASDDYSDQQIAKNVGVTHLRALANPLTSVSHLNTHAASHVQTFPAMPPSQVFGGSLDLSDLGVPTNGTVDALFLQSAATGRVDLMLVAGLTSVPEPSASVMIMTAVASLGVCLRRRGGHAGSISSR